METTKTKRLEDVQERWAKVAADPALNDLPYRVETNAIGQIILSPHKNLHSDLQEAIQDLLRAKAPEGRQPPEYALATRDGVKVPDVIWVSPGRRKEMRETGDPSTLAPEVCIEIMSDANTEDEMETKRALYRSIGADEVWIVDLDGTVRFFADDEMQASSIVPDFPSTVSTE